MNSAAEVAAKRKSIEAHGGAALPMMDKILNDVLLSSEGALPRPPGSRGRAGVERIASEFLDYGAVQKLESESKTMRGQKCVTLAVSNKNQVAK